MIPDPADPPDSLSRFAETRPVVLALLLGLAMISLFIPIAGNWGLVGADETRYVRVSRELFGRQDWYLLTLYGEPYDQKPPLPFWMMAGAMKLLGERHMELASRLPGILAAAGTLVVTMLVGGTLLGRRAGWLAAVILLTTAQFFDSAAQAKLDMPFTFWIALSVGAWMARPLGRPLVWKSWLLVWGGITLAFLTKGPLAVLVLLGAIAGESVMARSWRPWREARLISGLLFLAAWVGAWLWGQAQAVGDAFVAQQVQGETVNRLLRGDHTGPPWFYLPKLPTTIAPGWTLLAIPIALIWWRGRTQPPAADPAVAGRGARFGAVLGWFVVPFVVLCIASGKRESYILPLLPALALLLAAGVQRFIGLDRPLGAWARALDIPPAVLGAIALAAAALTLLRHIGLGVLHSLPFVPISSAVVMGILGSVLLISGVYQVARIAPAPTIWWAAHRFALTVLGGGMLWFAIGYPANYPRRPAEELTQRIDAELRRLPIEERLLAGIGKAREPSYHVLSDYALIPIRPEEILAKELPALPRLALLRTDKDPELQVRVAELGYYQLWRLDVLDDELSLYELGADRPTATIHDRQRPLTAPAQRTAGEEP